MQSIISASSQPSAWPPAPARSPSLVPTFSTRVRIRNVSSTGGMPTIGELHQAQRPLLSRGSSSVLRSKSLYVQRRRDSAFPADSPAAAVSGRPSRLDRRKLYPSSGSGVNVTHSLGLGSLSSFFILFGSFVSSFINLTPSGHLDMGNQ